MKVSVIIPVYNEEKYLAGCLESLKKQTVVKDMEVIVVDDGSTDGSKALATLHQGHQGPGAARNLGAKNARGEILVFADADMEFDPDFIEKLIAPILVGKTIGTFSKEEYLLNKDNVWARYWNLNLGRQDNLMVPRDHPDTAPVFRAILAAKFIEVGGFDTTVGYTDDWSLSRKLGVKSVAAPGAKFYHRNPETLAEVWRQSRWFGKNEFLTKNLVRRIYNLFRYCPVWAIFKIYDPRFLLFKVVYNSAVVTSVLLSFFGETKSK
ncbi:glycosyltransferase family 2 protein [Candidatus Microgenomates bacterium]|nr:glycosyltransferase family 2 protein [Candidatus Microgenomates bacterium]